MSRSSVSIVGGGPVGLTLERDEIGMNRYPL